MHQSGQLRTHSMQTVQFSDFSAITPRARGAGDSFSCGYWTVTAPRLGDGMSVMMPRFGNSVLSSSPKVIRMPVNRPGILGLGIRRPP